MSVTIQNMTSGAAIYAVSSGLDHIKTTSSTASNGNCTIARNYNGNAGTIVAIEFLPDEKGNKYANSFCIQVKWDNGGGTNRYCWQEVLFGHNPNSTTTVGAIWEYQSGGTWHELGTDLVNVTPDAIRVSAKSGSSGINTDPITDLTFSGYWVSGRGYADQLIDGVSDTTVGSCSNPASWPYSGSNNAYYHYLSWKRPANSSQILYYVVPIWKGYTQSDDRNGSLGGLSIVSSTAFVYNSSWGISSGYKIRYTVHAVYAIGAPYPSFNQSAATKTELNTGSSGATSTASYAIWRQGGTGGKTVKLLQFYETSDRTKGGAEWRLLSDSTNTDYSAPYIVGAPIVAPTEIKINGVDRSDDYSIHGWIRANNSWNDTYNRPTSWSTTEDVADSEHRLIKMPNYNFAYKQVLRAKERNLIMDHNDGTGNRDTRVVPIGEEYGIFPQLSRFGYDLMGWFTEAEGGTQVYPTTIMADGTTDVIIYAHWEEHWDTEIDDLTFLHYEKPSVKVGVKRDSLQNPEGVRLWVQGKLHPITDKTGKDKNFVTDITDIYWRKENRTNTTFRSGGTAVYDSRTYYNWQTAGSTADIIQGVSTNGYKTIPFETGILKNAVRTNSSAVQKDFDLNQEFQFRCLLRDALQSYYDKTSDAYGEDYPYSDENYSPWGQYLNIPKSWSTGATTDFQTRINSKSSGISDASNDGNGALLLKYVTKLLVHNPYMDEVLKETRIANGETKQLRDQKDPPETDFWQIRQHTQNWANTEDQFNDKDNLETLASLLKIRSNEMSVNGFQDVEELLIPTLKRALAKDENLVYDRSQIEKLVEILRQINPDHVKINREVAEYNEGEGYSGIEIGTADATNFDAGTKTGRILELDGERHAVETELYEPTESDNQENRLRDTDYKVVELRNFGDKGGEEYRTSPEVGTTVDHIHDYDISQLDLERSLSDLIYILGRMVPRGDSSKDYSPGKDSDAEITGAVRDFNDPNLDSSNKATYWDDANNRFKDSAFTKWVPSTGTWIEPESKLSEYASAVDGYSVLKGTESLDPGNSSENDFYNNGCKAACMGLCTSGCYQSCVGGCNTACGTSCFSGCSSGCYGSCGSGCATSCTGYCSGGCVGSCEGSCKTGCLGCSATCMRICKGTCGSGCDGTCEAVCKRDCSSGCNDHCTTSCSVSCGLNCTGGCQGSCIGSCSGTANKSCGDSCFASCGNNCGRGCTDSCSTSCGSGCAKSCKGTCSGFCVSDCTGNCKTTCNDTCSGLCTDGCQYGCSWLCTTSCTGSCKSSCEGKCTSSCIGECKGACTNTCTETCHQNCNSDCGAACRKDCMGACTKECGSSCDNKCYGQCKETCEATCDLSCGYNCNSSCESGCIKECTFECRWTCWNFCKNDCKNYCQAYCTNTCGGCASRCTVECAGSCNQRCYNACTGSCSTNCTEDCKASCNVGCTDECTLACKDDCTRGCENNCGHSCGGRCTTSCGNICTNSCGDTCGGTCQEVCAEQCGSSCTSTCGGNCTGKCSGECGGVCTGTCSSTCGKGCNNACTSACSGFCTTEGCKTTCGRSCSTACGRDCNSDCSTGCTSNCTSACTASCSGGCIGSCTGSCGTDCSGSCSGDCKLTCSGDCTNTCGDACSTGCGGSCSTGCQNSCLSSCTGSAYNRVSIA